VSIAELRAECDRDGIGPLFWEMLVSVCSGVARRYPPEVYNDGASWSDESLVDLAQDVVLERLLGENQLEYVLRLATDEDSLRRLVSFQVKRALNHRRSVTVVGRLTTRVREMVTEGSYATAELGGEVYVSADTVEPSRRLTDGEIREGADLIRSVPRLPSSLTGERESRVYQRDGLEEVMGRLLERFGGVAINDIRKILEITLTAWLPTILRGSEEESLAASSPELELQRNQMTELIEQLTQQLEPVHRTVLLGKSQAIADNDLAASVGRSRPWLADRKKEALGLVENGLIGELPSELHAEAVELLLERLGILEEDT